MAFERKEVNRKQTDDVSWNVLKWYWILVPAFYFVFVTPTLFEQSEGANVDDATYFVLFFLFLNLSLAGIMTYISPKERTRNGTAENVLKMAIAQQALSQNVVGVMLSLFAWYKLPKGSNIIETSTEETGKKYFEKKTLYILTVIIIIITLSLSITRYILL